MRMSVAATATRSATALVDTTWRTRVRAFALANLEHSAWGTAHAERNLAMARALASSTGTAVDDDALYAAAYLHDMGAIPTYAAAGVDHADRAVALVDAVLRDAGFPMSKAPLVREIIGHHMYDRAPGASPEAVCFRDADTLDFLGAIGVGRVLSITTRHRWAPDMRGAVATIRRYMTELPRTLTTVAAKREAELRVAEMQAFLTALESETYDSSALE